MNLEEYMVGRGCSVIEVMQQINQNSKGIVYVTEEGVLCGSITDGDVRRHLIGKGNLNEDVSSIMNNTPHFCRTQDREQAYEIMKDKAIRSIPIVDDKKRIVDIVFRDEDVYVKKEQINVPVVIMAGGKGTRLQPYTQILPKPLIPIGEKTITEHIMARFEEYGCTHFDMIVNYKKHFIKAYFDDENVYDVDFVEETEYLGTGGGLKLLEGRYTKSFFMTNCDILIEADYAKILDYHVSNNNIITMVCAEKDMIIPYGTVKMNEDGRVVALEEKPSLSFITNTGFYVIEPEFLEMIPSLRFVHITDIIQKCIVEGKNVGVFKISEDRWLDMGQMEEMEKMKQKLNV